MQVESVVTSVVPDSGRLLILSNGAYGKRLALIAERHGIDHCVVSASEREIITPSAVEAELLRAAAANGERAYSHVVVVHHETTSGILNPMHEIGLAVGRAAPEAAYIVDSMSAFGAYEVDMVKSNVSYMVSSANKNIEGVRRRLRSLARSPARPLGTRHTFDTTRHHTLHGAFTTRLFAHSPARMRAHHIFPAPHVAQVPGFAFAICRRDKLLAEGGAARTLSLDLLAQWQGLEGNGQFRFTPPTHALLAFRQALREHSAEGGLPASIGSD